MKNHLFPFDFSTLFAPFPLVVPVFCFSFSLDIPRGNGHSYQLCGTAIQWGTPFVAVRLGARKLPKSFISPFVCLLFLNRNINKWLARTGGNWTTVQLCGSYSCSHSIVLCCCCWHSNCYLLLLDQAVAVDRNTHAVTTSWSINTRK